MIIDIHTHIFPEEIAQRAVARLRDNCHTMSFSDGTCADLIRSSRSAGIGLTVALPVATSPRQVAHINDYAIQVTEQYRDAGLISFGGAHPDDPNWKNELKRIASSGLKGIKIHPPYQGVDVDAPPFLRLLEEAAGLGLIVVTHAGYDVGLPGNTCSEAAKLASALRKIGPIKLICAHMGGWNQWDQVCELLADTGVMLDTSFSLGTLIPSGDGYPWAESSLRMLTAERFCQMVRLFGADRILFGTDSPWSERKKEVEAIRSLPLTDLEKRKILGDNAEKLLAGCR